MNGTDALLQGCEAIGIPEETANELLKLLLIKTSVGRQKSQNYGQSQVLDQLLHWVLLNTDARKSVEAVVGKIHHSTATAKADCMQAEKEKAERRLNSMNAMSRFGWTPILRLWQEPGTLLDTISTIQLSSIEGARFSVYYTPQCGRRVVDTFLSDGRHSSSVADEMRFREPVAKRVKPSNGGEAKSVKHKVVIAFVDGERITFLARGSTKFGTLKKVACERLKVDPLSYALNDDCRIGDEVTVEEHLQSGGYLDYIYALKHQVGC